MSKVTTPTRLRGPLAIFEFLRTKLWLNNFLSSIWKGSLGYKTDRGGENVLCTNHRRFLFSGFPFLLPFRLSQVIPVLVLLPFRSLSVDPVPFFS